MSKRTDTCTERWWQGVGVREVELTTKVITLLVPCGIFRNLPGMSGNFILVAWWESCKRLHVLLQTELVIHYENNSPFLTVTEMTRVIEVSHWGNIAIEEMYDLVHSGAVLKGPFSRYDYQRHQDGISSVKSFKVSTRSFKFIFGGCSGRGGEGCIANMPSGMPLGLTRGECSGRQWTNKCVSMTDTNFMPVVLHFLLSSVQDGNEYQRLQCRIWIRTNNSKIRPLFNIPSP